MLDKETWTILTAYGEKEDARREEKDTFLEKLQNEIDDGIDNIIIVTNPNGQFGDQNEEVEEYMGVKEKEKETAMENSRTQY